MKASRHQGAREFEYADYRHGLKQEAPRIAILLGGYLTEAERWAVAQGERPRIDVLDLEERLDAAVYDYGWVEAQASLNSRNRRLLSLALWLVGWSAAVALFALSRLKDADLVYATGEDVGLPLAALLRILRLRKPRLIIRMEKPMYGSTPFKRRLFARYLGFALQRADQILTRTPAHARRLRAEHWVTGSKVAFVPETTDTRFFNAGQPADNFPGIPPEPYLISAGLEMRDYETLIRAARDLPLKVVVAAGSPWSQLQFRTDEDSLPANVEVASYTRSQMRELYRSAALVVVPVQQTERACGMNVVLEAWAMARPVVASRTRGLVDYISDGETGLLVNIGDVDDLSAKILYLLQNPSEAKRVAENGHCHATATLDLDYYLAKVTESIDELLGDAPHEQLAFKAVQ